MDAAALFRVDGMVAVVTGGGSGIGLTIAKTLALNGAAKVYILGRRLEKLQHAASLSPHGNIIPIQADVTSKDALAAAAERVRAETGYINLLVCNSGISGPQLMGMKKDPSIAELRNFLWENWSTEDFNDTLNVNVTSVFFTAVAFLELLDAGNIRGNMQETKSQIIVTASVASYIRRVTTGFAYVSSKAAVNHMAKSLSSFLIPYGIRVNILNPGVFPSEMTEGMIGRVPSFSAEALPGKRLGNERDLVGTTLYLCSAAGAYLNGLSLVIDGGTLSVAPSSY